MKRVLIALFLLSVILGCSMGEDNEAARQQQVSCVDSQTGKDVDLGASIIKAFNDRQLTLISAADAVSVVDDSALLLDSHTRFETLDDWFGHLDEFAVSIEQIGSDVVDSHVRLSSDAWRDATFTASLHMQLTGDCRLHSVKLSSVASEDWDDCRLVFQVSRNDLLASANTSPWYEDCLSSDRHFIRRDAEAVYLHDADSVLIAGGRVDEFAPRSNTALTVTRDGTVSDVSAIPINHVWGLTSGSGGISAIAWSGDPGQHPGTEVAVLTNHAWVPTASPPQDQLFLPQGVVLEGTFYMAGQRESDRAPLIQALDLDANDWREVPAPDLPEGNEIGVGTIDGKLLVWTSGSSFRGFVLEGSRWSKLPEPPLQRRSFEVTSNGTVLLIWGGDLGGVDDEPVETGQVFDGREWHTISEPPVGQRSNAAFFGTDELIGFWGGVDGDGVALNDGAVLSTSTLEWSLIDELRDLSGRCDPVAVALPEPALVVSGGSTCGLESTSTAHGDFATVDLAGILGQDE